MTAPTLVHLLLSRASDRGGNAYTFLSDDGDPTETIGYDGLADRALAIAGLLQEAGAVGEPILLIFPPGLDYVAAFLGCVCAGAIAVPAYPPDPLRMSRTVPRLAALVADAGARFALTTEPIRALVQAMGAEVTGGLSSMCWLATPQADASTRRSWRQPDSRPEDPALLQYTSGSTGTPRGIVLSHANLLHNSAAIHACFGHGPDSRGVIWLPPYHDMGLIGGVLQPLFGGFPVVLMSPLCFLARPVRWLAAITRFRATTSGGPNFAYDLCVRKTTPEQRAELDLSTWDLAFDGAEPIRSDTLDRFAAAFAPSGFRREAFYPCYGLAEGTLIASGGRKGAGPSVRTFGVEAIERGVAHPSPGEATRPLVGCGEVLPDQQIRIVDPERRVELPQGCVGEIWLRGPSVALGVWKDEAQTRESFGATLAGGSAPYLRTGDLGFMDGDELFVTGRRKDLVIVHGRNLYPQDLEATALACHPALRPGGAVAFSVDVGGEERLVLVLEGDPKRLQDAEVVLDQISAAVRSAHDLVAHEVLLLPPGELPKTSSGKVQRRATRDQYLAGSLGAFARRTGRTEPTEPTEPAELDRAALRALPAEARVALLVDWLGSVIEHCLDGAFDRHRPIVVQGMDSIRAIELSGLVEDTLGVPLPMTAVLDGATLPVLARLLAEEVAIEPSAGSLEDGPDPLADPPLSLEQERLLFLHELAPGSGAYNIAVAVFLEGELDQAALDRSLSIVAERHAVLRSSYPREDGGWKQRIAEPAPVCARQVELPAGAGDREALELAHAEARLPFDLQRGPVLRVTHVRVGPQRHLLVLVVHHLVADGWSMGVLVRELGEAYTAFTSGRAPSLPPLPAQVADLARAQRSWVASGGIEPSLAYWRETLAGAPPLLELPTDRPRPPIASFEGASVPIAISSPVTAAIHALARDEGATLFMTLVAGFVLLVAGRAGTHDIVLGTDVAGRSQARSQRLIGLFVNQVVLRIDTSGNPTFRTLVGRARETALGAFAHDQVPFGTLVGALRPPRDPAYNPIFQVMFVLESAPVPPLALPGLRVERVELEEVGAPFDLSVLLTEHDGGLRGVFRYRTSLYDRATIAGLVDDYIEVLSAVAAGPDVALEPLTAQISARAARRRAEQAEALKAASAERFRRLPRR
jgi:acyl-CoA synthetase (AMP-forming)/AMP-acid ligase II